MGDETRAVITGVLGTVGGTLLGWSVWVANWGNANEGTSTLNFSLAASCLFLVAVTLGVKTRSGERAWRASARAVQRSPLAIVSGLLATAGGFLLGWWLAAVGLSGNGVPVTGIVGLGATVLLLFVVAIGLQWGRSSPEESWILIGASGLAGAALFLLAVIISLQNYGGR